MDEEVARRIRQIGVELAWASLSLIGSSTDPRLASLIIIELTSILKMEGIEELYAPRLEVKEMPVIAIVLQADYEDANGEKYGRMTTVRASNIDEACDRLRQQVESWEANAYVKPTYLKSTPPKPLKLPRGLPCSNVGHGIDKYPFAKQTSFKLPRLK